MDNSEIKIRDAINRNLGMRVSAQKFFNELNNVSAKVVIINFENVEFMSRSFAQEYVQQKKRINKVIKEINRPEEVVNMFKAVNNSSKPKSICLASK